MVVEWLTTIAMQFGAMVAGLFPDFEMPAWIGTARDEMFAVLAANAGLGVWIPMDALKICVAATVSVYVLGPLLIRLVRAAIAHIPQFGGSGG